METLFRFHLLRPPALPDPRYPALQLAQDSSFQVALARAAEYAKNPQPVPQGQPQPKTMDDVANDYLAGPNFVDLDRETLDNMALDRAAGLIAELALGWAPLDENEASRQNLKSKLGELLGRDALEFAKAESTTALLPRLKDSIIAIRQVHIESPGQMEILALRLRLVDFVRKMSGDENFPLSQGDLRGWWQRTLLAPSLIDLQSILSNANARDAAREKFLESLNANYIKAKTTFAELTTIHAAISELKTLPNHRFRARPAPEAFAYEPPRASATREAFQTRHLQIMDTFANLGRLHYETVLKGASLREQASLVRDENVAVADRAALGLLQLPDTSGLASLVDMTKLLFEQQAKLATDPGRPGFEPIDPRQMTPTLTDEGAKMLSDGTRKLIEARSLDASNIPRSDLVASLEREAASHTAELDRLYRENDDDSDLSVSRVGNTLLVSRTVRPPRWHPAMTTEILEPPLFRRLEPLADSRIPGSKGTVTISGVCDLLVVKQQLVGYEGADVAHVEGVLIGEKKTREVTTRREVESLTYMETETATSSEVQDSTMERFEMSEEAEKEIKQEEALKAGVTISASYGPFVKMSANAEGSRTRSKEESTKTATKRAQEITSKATQKIQKRVLERSTLKITTESVDKTTHELGNLTGTSHTNGVYQFVTKIYEAQTYTYGKRTMLDFMIPEPGAFLFDGPGTGGQPPLNYQQLPDVPHFNLDPSAISEANYRSLAFTLGATDISSPPPFVTTKTFQHSHPTQAIDTSIAWSEEIEVPEGWGCTGTSFIFNFQWHRTSGGGVVTIGSHGVYPVQTGSTSVLADSSWRYEGKGKVPVSVAVANLSSWSLVVKLVLERTTEAFDAWKFDTWSKLTARRQKLIADKEAKEAQLKADAAAAAYAQDPSSFGSGAIKGTNPAFNEQIMRDEMKKHCISIMTDQHFDDFDSVETDSLGRSQVNLYQAAGEGPYVRFFEQAFEWDQMTWSTYPYFWGRKSHWFKRIAYDDPDPAFRDFMRAGFARANAPVRPRFEGAIDHFLNTGRVWQGGSLPNIGCVLFLPIATEIEEDLGKTADEEKYGEPWLVRVPTSLITLRKDDKLPTWKKQLDGSWLSSDSTPSHSP